MESIDKSLLKILQKKASGTVAIFERNDFFTCYEDDAFLVANEIFLSETGLRRVQIGLSEITYHNLNSGQYARVVRDVLLLLHYRLEVYTANEGSWQLKAKGSLGCLGDFEDMVGNSVELSELSTVMALVVTDETGCDGHRVSAAFCNAQDLRMTVAEFSDTEHFSNLEKCLTSLIPRDCIVLPSSSKSGQPSQGKERVEAKMNQLDTALKRANVTKVPFKDENFIDDVGHAYEEVNWLVQDKCKGVHVSDVQLRCLSVLIKHLQLSNDPVYEKRFQLVDYKSAGFMYLDMAAVRALELFTVSYDEDGGVGESSTLYELMNKCRTPQGQRLLRDWMRRPLFDMRRIKERLDVVEALQVDQSCRIVLHHDLMRRVPDVAALSRRLAQKKATLQDCYRLYQLICLLRKFEEVLGDLHAQCGSLAPAVNDLCYEPIRLASLQFEKFAALIETTVDVRYFEETGTCRIKPEIDDQLLETAERMKEIEADCKKALSKISGKLPESVKLDSNSQLGFFFRVTLKAEKSLRQLGLKVIDTSKGSGVRFTSVTLDALNGEFLELQRAYDAAQSELARMVVETCAGYLPALSQLSETLAVIDVLTAFSVLASDATCKYTRPELLEKGTRVLSLKGCRHPVLEVAEGCTFIPNDVVMGDGDETRFLLLTGANMGGKSTYLRSCAITVLMGQMGCFVPCDSARFSLVDGIHTRIGSCDYQCKGVSTFMAEMIDSASILEAATSNSLVIIDELGRGTSTYDGFGLAWAIADDILTRIRCFCVFATHFHEMTSLSDLHPKALKNICVATHIDEADRLTLLYRVVPGVAERSFGLNIAKIVGLPPEIVETASKMLSKLERTTVVEKEPEEALQLIERLKRLQGEELRAAILAEIPV